MSIKETKLLDVILVSKDYGVTLSSHQQSCALVHTVDSVVISGDTAKLYLSTTVNGIVTGNSVEYQFVYDKTGKDVIQQAEDYLKGLAEFADISQ